MSDEVNFDEDNFSRARAFPLPTEGRSRRDKILIGIIVVTVLIGAFILLRNGIPASHAGPPNATTIQQMKTVAPHSSQ